MCFTGLRISGNEGSLTVGDTATLTCSSDLDVTMIEWLRDGEVVVSSTATVAELVLNQVNDSIHEVEYTCRVTSPYGSEERSTTVVVSGKKLPQLTSSAIAKPGLSLKTY